MKHGLSETRLYKIWSNMKQRCYNENATSYNYYGEKGITICDEWLNDFQAFYDWAMANGYTDDLTIDRIKNDGNYCPENCRWITLDENSRRGKSERIENDITRIRNLTGLSQSHFSEKYHIPLNTFARWEQGKREPPDYLVELLEFKVREDLNMNMHDLINREAKIGDKEGEITNILGCALEVTFFNVNDGKTIIYPEDVDKYLVDNREKTVSMSVIDEMKDLKDALKSVSAENAKDMIKHLTTEERDCLLRLYVYENK